MNFIRNFFNSILGKKNSKNIARDRLRLILIQDRVATSPGLLESLREELCGVISKYMVVEPETSRVVRGETAGLPGRDSSDSARDTAIDDSVLGLVVERGGSISAEHGIGVAKKRWLERNRSASEVEAMRAVKAALDPDGILNPNVLLP